MSSSSTVSVGITNTKPPVLIRGQYQHWKDLFTKWIQSNDYQCWLVIHLGDKQIKDLDLKLKSHDWEQDDLNTMEKNSKAQMYITNALCQEDVEKLQSCTSAKAKWEALEQMYMGSKDLRQLERFRAKKDFYNFKMLENEEVGAYQARFEKITARLHAHGIKDTEIPQNEKILIIIDGLPHRHKMTKAILNETANTAELSFHEVFGKIQKYDDEDKAGKADPNRGIALMIEKAVELVVNDQDDDISGVDPDTALITRGMRTMLQRRNNNQKRDLKDIECFNCHEKGHYSSNCPKEKKTEKKPGNEEKKAFVAIWGNEGENSGEDEPDYWGEQTCAMAIKESTDTDPSEDSEVDPTTFFNSLVNHNKNSLISLIKTMYYDQLKTNEELDKAESIVRTSVTPSHTCKCIDCSSYCGDSFSDIKSTHSDSISLMVHKDRSSGSEDTEMSRMKKEVSETKVMVESILKAFGDLGNQAVKEKIDEDAFLRQGIGYKEASKEEKSVQELREARDKELQDLRGKCKYLEEHVMALEQGVEMTDLERKERHGSEDP